MTSTPPTDPSESENLSAIRQHRSITLASPSTPSCRSAAQTGTTRARRENSGLKSMGLRNSASSAAGRYAARVVMERRCASGWAQIAIPQS